MKVKILSISSTKKSALVGTGNATEYNAQGFRAFNSAPAGFISTNPAIPMVVGQELELPDNWTLKTVQVKEFNNGVATGRTKDITVWS